MDKFEEMRNVDVRGVDRNFLKDIRDVVVDTSLPHEERLESFLKQIGNPYCYKYKDIVVKISFSEDSDETLEDKLKLFLAKNNNNG